MPYISINDFKRGLDTRRSELSSLPGTLLQCNNAHINEGGQVEKRKAFVKTTMPGSTFGLQQTSTTVLKFGSATAPSMPSGFSYQRLQHPAVLAGTTYNGALHAMKGVIASTLFGTAAFVVAQFADDGVYCYYDGSLVSDFVAGKVLAYMSTNGKIATNIVSLLGQTSSYASSTQVGSSAVLDIVGPVGATYGTTQSVVSTSGTLASQIKNNGLQPINGQQAVGQFVITAGSNSNGVNYISSVKLNAGAITLTSSSVNFQQTVYDTAIAVANNISANAGVSSYYAIAISNVVSIFSLNTSNTPNGYDVVVVTAGNVCIGKCVVALSGDPTGGVLAITAGTTNLVGGPAVATVSHSLTSNVATMNTATAHGLVVGSKVTIAGCTDTNYNGTGLTVASTPSSTSFTYAKTHANIAFATDTTGTITTTIAVGGQSSINALASSIATAVNFNSTNGYCACAVGNLLYFSKVSTSSSDAAVTITISPGTGLVVGDVTPTGTQVALTTYALYVPATITAAGSSHGINSWNYSWAATGSVSVVLSGQTNAPYQYNWGFVSGSAKIAISSPTNFITTFTCPTKGIVQATTAAQVQVPTTQAIFDCVVTGSDGISITTSQLVVTFGK
jgi:hypothetical protein